MTPLPPRIIQPNVLADIQAHLVRADVLHGPMPTHQLTILAVCTEELGEVGKAMFEHQGRTRVREELLDLIAAAVRAVEALS